jgi:hypothetical protein
LVQDSAILAQKGIRHLSTAVRAGRLPYKAGANVFIALVVWGAGVIFTCQAIPIDEGLGPLAPWGAAFLAQLALSLGQANIRDGGIRWPYILLVLADIALNAIGLLVLYGVILSPGAALVFALRAVTTGADLWQLIAALGAGALVAALPEQLVRDAVKG